MKKFRGIIITAVVSAIFLLPLPGCKKEHVAILPSLATAQVTNLTLTSATSGGSVTSDGGAAITARGVCWSTSATPTIADNKTTDGEGTGSFISSITNLTGNTLYHVRAYATNSAGTAYGKELEFTTFGLQDGDGNGYHTVLIGTQEWMKENLKTTTYADGSAIPIVTQAGDWIALSTGAYSEYNNTAANVDTYGRLYNWYAVTDSRNVCPDGWHVPADSEWDDLVTVLGGETVAGGKMKATGTLGADGLWNSPNTAATNSSGFTGLPAGERGDSGEFNDLNSYAHWWSSDGDPSYAWFRRLQDTHGKLERFNNYSRNGKSVRCLKD